MSDELGEPKGHLRLVHSGDVDPPCEGIGLLDIDWNGIKPEVKEVTSSNPFPSFSIIKNLEGGFLRVQLSHEEHHDIPFKSAAHAMSHAADSALVATTMLQREDEKGK